MINKYQKGYYFDTSERYKGSKGYFGKGVWKKNGQRIGLGKISIDDIGDSYQLNSDGTVIKLGDKNGLTNAGKKMIQSRGLQYILQENPQLTSVNQQQNPKEYEGLSSKIVGKTAKVFGLDDDLEKLGNKGISGALAKGLIDSAMYFTPIGSIISGYDAIQNFKRGNWKAGLTDAAFVLPFIGGLGKLVKVGAKASKTLTRPALITTDKLNKLQKSNVSKFSNGLGLGMVGNDLYHAFFKEGGIVKAQNGTKNKFNYFQKFAEEKERVKKEQKEQGVDLESRWNKKLDESTKKVDNKIEKERNVRNSAVQRESRKRTNFVENITGLQERLFKGGFYDEGTTYEKAVDGIMGPLTEKALAREVAARKSNPIKAQPSQVNQATILGPVGLISAIGSLFNRKRKYTPWKPELKAGDVCYTEECAQYANDALRNYKDLKGRNVYSYDNIGGHAWTRLSSGKDSKMTYSGYDNKPYDINNYSERASNLRNWKAADNLLKNFDSKTLDKNTTYLVNMYFNSSPNKRKAWEEALNGTTGTHTGNLYWNPETNSWRVSHNIHGKIHDDDFISVQGSKNKYGYGVTAIAEAPRNKAYYYQEGNKLPEVTITAINPNKFSKGSDAYKFTKALNDNRNLFMKKYNLSDNDYADLAKFGLNIAQRETKLGRSTLYNIKKIIPETRIRQGKALTRGTSRLLKGEGFSAYNDQYHAPLSRGLTQIKYASDIKDPELAKEYNSLGITDTNLKYNIDSMAKATIARANYGNNFLDQRSPSYHYTNNKIIPKQEKLALWWNRGKLTDKVNLDPNDSNNNNVGGATGYVRRFLHDQKELWD